MAKAFKVICVWTVVAVVLYVLGSFVAATFDIAAWAPEGRAVIGFLWMALSGALTAVVIAGRFP